MKLWRWLAAGWIFTALAVGQASQPNPTQALLARLSYYPALVQSWYSLQAARAQLAALRSPVSLSAQGGKGFMEIEAPPASCQTNPKSLSPDCVGLPSENTRISISLKLTPFPFGNVQEQISQAQVRLSLARLSYRQTLAVLEAQALEAAYQQQLAQDSVTAAQADVKAARAVLAGTQLQVGKQAASKSKLRQAQLVFAGAESRLWQAHLDLGLASANLSSLVGKRPVPTLPIPSPPSLPAAEPPAVTQARLNLQSVLTTYNQAKHTLWPVAQLSYTRHTSDNDSLSASINSSTLQPTLGYNFVNPGNTAPQNRITGEWQASVSLVLSPAAFKGLAAAQEQLTAAKAGLAMALTQATLQKETLMGQLKLADKQSTLAQLKDQDAEETLLETTEREKLGLVSPLQLLQARSQRAQSSTYLQKARLQVLGKTLDIYRYYAIPLLEVHP